VRGLGWLALVLLFPSLAASWYFAVALPRYNGERMAIERARDAGAASAREKLLAVERDRAEADHLRAEGDTLLRAKIDAEDRVAAAAREKRRADCLDQAAADHDAFLHANGSPVEGKPGFYSMPARDLEALEERYRADRDGCMKL
jgi:hypothetical protein